MMLSILLMNSSYAQPSEACQLFLKEVLEHTKEVNLNKDNHLYFIEYGIKTVERKSTQPPIENKIHLYTDQHYRYIYTNQANFYIDTLHAITVVPSSKIILVNVLDEKMKQAFRTMTNMMDDSLIDVIPEVLSCNDVSGNPNYDKEVFVKSLKKDVQVEKMKYCINSTSKSIYKIVLIHEKVSKLVTTECIFYKTNYNYTEKKIDKPVYSLFFKADGSLVPYYKEYKVVDKRSQSQQNIK